MAEFNLTPVFRMEKFIDAIINGTTPPVPRFREEFYFAKVAGMDVELPTPITRREFYLAKYAGMDVDPPAPVTRDEMYLALVCGLGVEPPEPVFRDEYWLYELSGGGGWSWKTVTGTLLHITDAIASPVQALSVAIEPKQSGSGDPSPTNVRPITGWTGCNIYRSGADTSNPTTYPISWQTEAGTVYGGTLDVVSGELTVDTRFYTLNGTEDWHYTGSDTSKRIYYLWIGASGYARYALKCSHFKTEDLPSSGTNVGYAVLSAASTSPKGSQIRFRAGLINGAYINSTDNFKAWLATQYTNGTPVQCTVKLTSPTTYQLTPQEVSTLAGENNIWADCGDVEITYKAQA